ncbi:hypothetical protein Tco_1107664 [Tanacetum coccineum]
MVESDKVLQTVKTDMVKHDVEVESSGECVDEIDKLTELQRESVQFIPSLVALHSDWKANEWSFFQQWKNHSSMRYINIYSSPCGSSKNLTSVFQAIGGLLCPPEEVNLSASVVIVVQKKRLLKLIDRWLN